jgi:hypothetical protein
MKFKEAVNVVHEWSLDGDLKFSVKKCNFVAVTTVKCTQSLRIQLMIGN